MDPSTFGGEFYRADQPWSESVVTWNTAPLMAGGALATIGPVVSNTWYEVDLTPYITGDGTYSLRVSSPSSDGADYASSEGAGGFTPVLVLTLGGP